MESEWTHSEAPGPERRVYKVTQKGTEALRSGLESIARRKTMMDDLAEYYRTHFENRAKEVEKIDV